MNWVMAGSILLLVIVSILSGYFLAVWRMRRISGGKTAAELQQELDDYRNEVSEHFAESAELLGRMTEQYREVYSHIARGSHKLGTGEELPPRVEQLRARLVEDNSTQAAPDAEHPDGDIESQGPRASDHSGPENSREPGNTGDSQGNTGDWQSTSTKGG